MSITTALIIAGFVLGIFFLILLLGIFVWIINRSTVKTAVREAVSNAKPSTINHGTIVNHYHGHEIEEDKSLNDDAYLQMSRYAGEFAKQLLPKTDESPEPVRRRNQNRKNT